MSGRAFALTAVICLWGVQAMAADGLITIRSSYGPKETMNRLEAEVKAKGLTVFARIDHGEALLMMHTGRPISGFPSVGCWVTYALGTVNDSMPAYVALPDTDAERLRNANSAEA